MFLLSTLLKQKHQQMNNTAINIITHTAAQCEWLTRFIDSTSPSVYHLCQDLWTHKDRKVHTYTRTLNCNWLSISPTSSSQWGHLLMKTAHMYTSTCTCWASVLEYIHKHIIFPAGSNRISYLITWQTALIRKSAVSTLLEQEGEVERFAGVREMYVM